MFACGGAARPSDAGSDASTDVAFEAYTFDAGCANGDPCAFPRDISTFVAPGYVGPRAPTMACSAAQLHGYWGACAGPTSSPASCASWRNANGSCAPCLESAPTDPALGPALVYPDRIVTNLASCVALQSDVTCAVPLERLEACVHAACGGRVACNPDPLDFGAYAQCATAAKGCACKEYADAVVMRCAMGPSSAWSKCSAPDPEAAFVTVATMSCGG